ncbi:MAG: Molybdenum cofactor biosynthesis protein MoaB [Labilithrix sp.]|nr:Molybdenum cofactor biosynthesis protein MoaB [Labilithrix sp.]
MSPSRPRVITVTVSDTRITADDASGKALMEELAGFDLVRHEIVPDEPERITAIVTAAVVRGEADAVVFTGGTGIAPRDRTFEALASLFDKQLDGFGEAFRRLSWDEIGPRAILSRATAGTVGACLVFLLPGSEKAARLGARALIAPVLGHAVDLVNGRTKHGHGKAGS